MLVVRWKGSGMSDYARSGGAPNYAPSLRSVAGLLVARCKSLMPDPFRLPTNARVSDG